MVDRSSIALIISFVVALVITILIGAPIIKFLKALKMKQTERIEGVQSHLQKSGTPTMGGIMMIVAFNISMIYWAVVHDNILWILLLITDGFAAIGFIDDYLKVVLKRSDGFKPKEKLIAQILITTLFCAGLYLLDKSIIQEIKIPFAGYMEIGNLGIVLLFFAVLGTVNAVNFTDGIDGLASSVTIVVSLFFLIAALQLNKPIASVPIILIGCLLGFLFYNKYPAKVFMGDTGSLFLGAAVVGMAYLLKLELYIIIVGFIYLAEILSVVIQVIYFKATHGKRVFKMTPIHHHFELTGFSEVKIVFVFTVATIIFVAIGIIAL